MSDGPQLNQFMLAHSMNFAAAPGIWQELSLSPQIGNAVSEEVRRLAALRPSPQLERLAGLHNPWSNTAVPANRWAFLDLCEVKAIVAPAAGLIGSDVILWDSQLYLSASDYNSFVASGREGRYWPVHPLAGVVALISFGARLSGMHARLADIRETFVLPPNWEAPLLAIRYFPGSSRFVRDPRYPANWVAMEEQVLLNYTTRALWLVAGQDRAGNDFVTGFSEQSPSWTPRD
ncbi:MAG TPA: resolvase [Pseudolabrys sp.]|nr:resolvase [Pseudolabrys sp.]